MIDHPLHDKLIRVCALLTECHKQLIEAGVNDDARIIRAAFNAASPVRDRVGLMLDDAAIKKVVNTDVLEPVDDNER